MPGLRALATVAGPAALRRPIMVAAAAAGATLALLKRRRGQADTALWREATSDSSR